MSFERLNLPDMTEDERKKRRKEVCKRYYYKNHEKELERSRIKTQKTRDADPEKYNQYMRDYRDKNPEKVRWWWLKSKYGLSREQYEALLASQGGTCALCNSRKLVVDHDHETGKVRGLLCSKHNIGLGQFDDSAQELLKAVEYLSK